MLGAVTCLSNPASKYYSNNLQYKSVIPPHPTEYYAEKYAILITFILFLIM
jgi:hypothetical protein